MSGKKLSQKTSATIRLVEMPFTLPAFLVCSLVFYWFLSLVGWFWFCRALWLYLGLFVSLLWEFLSFLFVCLFHFIFNYVNSIHRLTCPKADAILPETKAGASNGNILSESYVDFNCRS